MPANQAKVSKSYTDIIRQVISEGDKLPSLPSITLKIRQSIVDPQCDHQRLAKLISLDPGLTALIMKCGSSPIYRSVQPSKTLEQVIAKIGLSALESLVMKHSLKSLFVIKSPEIKKLFQLSWKRMVTKAVISQFLAQRLGFRPPEKALTASILTEVGTLAILSSLDSVKAVPDLNTYVGICRKFSKSLSAIILRRWGLGTLHIELTEACGRWGFTHNSKELNLIDIIDLAIYETVQKEKPHNDLPPITSLNSYQKLPASLNAVTDKGTLLIIENNLDNIHEAINTFE